MLSYTIVLAQIMGWRQADSNRWHPPRGKPPSFRPLWLILP